MAFDYVGYAEAAEEVQKGRPRLFIERYLQVQDESGLLVPFAFKENQEYYYRETFGSGRRKRDGEGSSYDEGMYVHCVKARKAYSTKYWQAVGFAFRCCVPGFKMVMVTDSDKNMREILETDDIFYNNMPPEARIEKDHWDTEFRSLSHLGAGSTGTVNSSVTFSSAKSRNFMRGGTPKLAVKSEAAHYDRAFEGEMNSSLGQSLPAGAWEVDESTPFGVDNIFYSRFEAMREGKLRGVRLFRCWFEKQANVLAEDAWEVPAEERGQFAFTDEEADLARLFPQDGISAWDRMRWRRQRLRVAVADCFGNEAQAKILFLQEHPENDVDCFLSSNTAASLPADRLRAMLTQTRPPLERTMRLPGVWLSVWERPRVGGSYVAGYDPSDLGGDANCLQVVDARTGVHVAELYGLSEVGPFTVEACKVAEWYNRALLGIDNTGMGLAAVVTARRCGYPNLWRPWNNGRDGGEESYGIHWSAGLKGVMHDNTWQNLFNGALTTYSRDLVADMLKYDMHSDHTPDRFAALLMADWLRTQPRAYAQLQQAPQIVVPVGGGQYSRSIW